LIKVIALLNGLDSSKVLRKTTHYNAPYIASAEKMPWRP